MSSERIAAFEARRFASASRTAFCVCRPENAFHVRNAPTDQL